MTAYNQELIKCKAINNDIITVVKRTYEDGKVSYKLEIVSVNGGGYLEFNRTKKATLESYKFWVNSLKAR